ncbi:peptidase C2 calpain [Parafrankia soli]|uniref:Peptidase C2 calpain n=1 Tax=Parafrankia soli TaxID=2599596 RepID=A0A1S1Q3D5_9ACTN|nr:C2 family cysteine protease [Parafrankia soli]OHV28106.1 peptidase C2 calpain [Parafrankia soli]
MSIKGQRIEGQWIEGQWAERAPVAAAAAVLRRVAVESSSLLAPVIVLDDDKTWRSPWQRRCHGRIDEWTSALAAGARAAREQAVRLEFLAARGAWGAVTLGPAAVSAPRSPVSHPAVVGVAFSPERLAELARRLRRAADDAARLAAEVRRVAHALPGDMGGALAAEGCCRGLDRVAAEAPDMAGAIDGRLAYAASGASGASAGFGGSGGFATSAPAVERAPGPEMQHAARLTEPRSAGADTARTVAELTASIGADPFRLDPRELSELSTRLGRLGPAELRAVIGGLRGRPLEVLAAAVRIAPTRVELRTLGLLPAVLSLGDLLLRGAPASMVAEIARLFPGLEPSMGGRYRPWAYTAGHPPSTGDLTMRDHGRDPVWASGVTPSDVGQGAVGDCYLLAALIGIAQADPGLLRRNLRENPNGTVSVTVHLPTGAVPVTVTRSLPARAGAGQEIAADADNAAGEPELWAALYEKACARMAGSYARLEGGDPATAMEYLTGTTAARRPPSAVGVDELAARLAAGGVVTVVTRSDLPPGCGLVPNHAYAVLKADARTGQVLLRNPWDQTGTDNRLDWRDWDGLKPALAGVQWASTGRGPPAR